MYLTTRYNKYNSNNEDPMNAEFMLMSLFLFQ